MKILASAINSIGIGHLSRLIAICDTMRRLDPDLKVLFLTEISDFRLLQTYGFPYYFVPPPKKIANDSEYKKIGVKMASEVRLSVIDSIVKNYEPDLVLHDSLVDRAIFDASKRIHARQAFVTRSRRNLPEIFRDYNSELSEMGLVILAEMKNDNIDSEFNFNFYNSGQIIRRHPSSIEMGKIRKKYMLSGKEPVITISNGGGANFGSFEDNYWDVMLNVLENLDKNGKEIKVITIAGPMGIIPKLPRLKHLDTTAVDYEPNLIDLFSVSTLNICRGGYNTINELAAVGAEAICVPAQRHSDDQAQRIIDTGKENGRIHFCDLEPDKLYILATQILSSRSEHDPKLPSESEDKYLQDKILIAKKLLSL